jgi:RimJ/RimL family protein N-acetyltransferase
VVEVAADDVSAGEPDWLGPGAAAPVLRARRVRLRAWREDDLEPFATLNADQRVMEHYPAPLTRAESDDLVRRVIPQFGTHGFSLWAVELPGAAPFIGYVGLLRPTFETRFTPCVEIGWRLAFPFWGYGYATESARAVLAFGFGEAGLDEIVSFTVPANRRSVAVMERLNMTQDGEFNHPRLPHGHPLQRHLLYRLSKKTWRRDTVARDTLDGHS